jgi:hypothetical protein
MKKVLLIALTAALALSFAPGRATSRVLRRGTLLFRVANAQVPGGELCAYNAPNANRPTAYADGTQDELACVDPSPAGSWTDLVVTAPAGANHLKLVGLPETDWDIALCAYPARGGSARYIAMEDQQGNPFITDNLTNGTACVTGCPDVISVAVKAGRKYIVRAYNFADSADLRVQYEFKRIG